MCFSASASFIAAAALATTGVATLRMASRPSELPFAAVPLLFGIQQFIEGLTWLVTFLAAYAIHAVTLVPVWCFFAAILSLIVYVYFRSVHSRDSSAWPPSRAAET